MRPINRFDRISDLAAAVTYASGIGLASLVLLAWAFDVDIIAIAAHAMALLTLVATITTGAADALARRVKETSEDEQ